MERASGNRSSRAVSATAIALIVFRYSVMKSYVLIRYLFIVPIRPTHVADSIVPVVLDGRFSIGAAPRVPIRSSFQIAAAPVSEQDARDSAPVRAGLPRSIGGRDAQSAA